MKNDLQHLEGEAILLMYLGNELPAQDQAEFEQRLATDAALRREMEILRQTQQLAFDALGSVDAVTRPAVPVIVAQRRVSRLMHEWVDRHRRPAATGSQPWLQLPWRRINIAAAAVLLVGCYIWAVYHHLLDPHSIYTANNVPTVSQPFADEPLPNVPPHRDLAIWEKVALLSMPLGDSTADESNLHVAEVAAVSPSDAGNLNDANAASSSSAGSFDRNATGEP
jgi:hypothetical protein